MAATSLTLPNTDTLLTEIDAARFLAVSARTLQKWRVQGKGPPFIKISARCVRYRVGDVVQWVQAHLLSSTSAASAPALSSPHESPVRGTHAPTHPPTHGKTGHDGR